MRLGRHLRTTALAASSLLLLAGGVAAQERGSSGFLDNFSRGEQPEGESRVDVRRGGDFAQADAGDISVRLDRMEHALRQITGTLEQLQYRNQQLEIQLKRMQDDTEYRLQQLGSRGGAPGAAAPRALPPGPVNAPPPATTPGRRSDVFDPAQHPDAPGAPRVLGNAALSAPVQNADNAPAIGAPGGRDAGAPLDLSTMAGRGPAQPPMASANAMTPAQLPPPGRDAGPAAAQLATLPPSGTPQDEYDMAYGYVLHKDYALAEQGFRDFLRKYPSDRRVADAQYWLGETMFQRQRYRDAAESFLAVSTKYEHAEKAPDSLLRLGQSLAALNQKEAACATLAEVGRKFPRASASVKRGVAQEQKRAHC
jgi:tol-pal system protein YbgF